MDIGHQQTNGAKKKDKINFKQIIIMEEKDRTEKQAVIPVRKLLDAYEKADENGKEIFLNLYGSDIFINDYKRIKTFEDACNLTGDDPCSIEGITPKHLKAYAKLCVIAKALRGKWKPDWGNFEQCKYFPWFKIEKQDTSLCVSSASRGSCVGLSCLYSYDDVPTADAYCGGALASETYEIAIYFGKQFSEIWKDYLLV